MKSRFRNAIKGVACAQTSVSFRNAIKISCCVHLHKFIVLSAVAAKSDCHDIKRAKVVTGARKKELGAWREIGRENRASVA